MTNIALATCSNLPTWESDDEPLHRAFVTRGVTISHPVWDDASVDWSQFDACLIRTTWDYQEKRDAFVTWAERVGELIPLFNSASIIRWNTHKSYLRDLESRGVAIIPTIWCDAGSGVSLPSALADVGWDRAFLKPAVGATARETMRFGTDMTDLGPAQTHLDRMTAHEDMLLQPYLEAVETDGEFSAFFIDGTLTHGVRKIPQSGDYRVQDDFGGKDEPYEWTGDELTTARNAVAAAIGNPLYARVDFLRGPGAELLLTELELVEPSLFFRHAPQAAEALADAVCRRLA